MPGAGQVAPNGERVVFGEVKLDLSPIDFSQALDDAGAEDADVDAFEVAIGVG